MLIPLEGRGPLSRRLYAALREAILAGRLAPGARLPSTRGLASEQGLSRTTVQTAFEQLTAEGYLEARRGAGTFVAQSLPAAPSRDARTRSSAQPRLSACARRLRRGESTPFEARRGVHFDFDHGAPPVADFPHALWMRLAARARRTASRESFLYGPAQGEPCLREAIAEYLCRSRALRCTAEQVVIVSGSQQALDLCARVWIDPGELVLLEEPHYRGARRVFAAAGARLSTSPVDEEGIDARRFTSAQARARLVYVTPSHQFPTGVTMSVSRRLELLAFAEAHELPVIEDDYDGEYRYEERPLESLQGLDRSGRVVYVGTFSKVLYPALRIGYMILPRAWVELFVRLKHLTDRQTETFGQRTLASFIAEGHFERHLRRMRKRNAARREALLEALAENFGERVEIQGQKAGLHLLAWLRRPPARGIEAALARVRRAGIRVHPVSPCYLGTPPGEGLLLGFASMDEKRIALGIRLLAQTLWPAGGR